MKGGKRRRRHHGHYSAPADSTAEEMAAQLAPPEEQDPKLGAGGAGNGGAIVVDAGSLKLPAATARQRARFFNDRVVIAIVAAALLFTAFIAWRVSKMRDEPQPVRIIQE